MNSNHKKPSARNLSITGLILAGILAIPLLGHAEQVAHSYDDLNRLIRSDYGNGNVINYFYDAAGNRVTQFVNQPRLAAIECLLNWAESNYPDLFSPSGSLTAAWSVYNYRYYSATNAYVGVSSNDDHAYYMGPDGILQNEGPLSYWLPTAGCQ